MSGQVRIVPGVADSAASSVGTAQSAIEGCRSGGPTEVDAGEVTDVIVGAVDTLVSAMEEVSGGLGGFVDALRQTVSGFESTDQDVADGAQAQAWRD